MERNNIYSDEIYSKVNSESKELLNDYILELKVRNRAKKTIEQYEFDIKSFLCYVYDNMNNKSILELKRRDFRNFFLFMKESGKSAARINRMQSSIRNLLQFAEDDEEIYEDYEVNPMRKIKSVEKEPVREIVFLTDEQVTYLIDYLLERGKTQKALFVSFAYTSAARRNEIAQVEKYSFLEDDVYRTSEVRGKRGKQFPLMYDDRTKEIAKKWLDERGEDNVDSLWVSYYNGEPRAIVYDTFYAWAISFRSILEEKFGGEIPLNSHSFRHTALQCYEDGTHHALKFMGIDKLDINTLRILANHTSVSTTQSYLKNKDQEILENLFS